MEDNKESSQDNAPEGNVTIDKSAASGNNQNKVNENKKNSPRFKFGLAGIKKFYESQYKKLLIIPFALLIISLVMIGLQFAKTGDFINRDVSLKGGVTITIPLERAADTLKLESALSSQFPANDIAARSISQFGKQIGIIVEADIAEGEASKLVDAIEKELNINLKSTDYSVEIVGSSLGASFFKEIITALAIAFVFMSIVVFLYFRTFVPSMAVILAAFSDMIVTLAIANLMGLKISAAGIAAFLMLIGYSVDTDILLSTRLLKRKEGTEMERIYGAIDTGFTMSLTALVAVIAGLIFTQSEVIRQIMTILLIGLLIDLINTWIQNVGILRLYLERKARKAAQ